MSNNSLLSFWDEPKKKLALSLIQIHYVQNKSFLKYPGDESIYSKEICSKFFSLHGRTCCLRVSYFLTNDDAIEKSKLSVADHPHHSHNKNFKKGIMLNWK